MLVTFGGFKIVEGIWFDPAFTRVQKETEDDDEVEDEEGTKILETTREFSEVRSKLLAKLDASGEVKSVEDLFDKQFVRPKEPFVEGFDPIIATINLPYRMQTMAREWGGESQAQRVESFYMVYDGRLVVYAAEVDLKMPCPPRHSLI